MVQVHHLFHVGQSQTESLDIVRVSRVYTVEPVKNPFEVFLADTYAIVLDGDTNVLTLIPRSHLQMEIHIFTFVFDRIVHQVEDDIGEVHLISHDKRVDGLKRGLYRATALRHLQLERLYHIGNNLVGIQFHHLQRQIVLIEEAHLEHLLHLETQTSGFGVNDIAQSRIGFL